MASRYIFKERRPWYGDAGLTEVDRVTGTKYLVDPRVDKHHLISISLYYIMTIHTLTFPTFSPTCSVRDCVDPCNCMHPQHRVISYLSHTIATLLKLEPLFLMNSVWMWWDMQRIVNSGLCALLLHCFTTVASKWCICKFSQWAYLDMPPIMLEYHLRPDWPYVCI